MNMRTFSPGGLFPRFEGVRRFTIRPDADGEFSAEPERFQNIQGYIADKAGPRVYGEAHLSMNGLDVGGVINLPQKQFLIQCPGWDKLYVLANKAGKLLKAWSDYDKKLMTVDQSIAGRVNDVLRKLNYAFTKQPDTLSYTTGGSGYAKSFQRMFAQP